MADSLLEGDGRWMLSIQTSWGERTIRRGNLRMIWRDFLRSGSTTHSSSLTVMPFVVALCEDQKISYRLTRLKDGALIERIQDD